jgi:hypothetical protein
MPDGSVFAPSWPLLLSERTAARMCDMTLRHFHLAVRAGLLPAGRTPQDLARAGLISAETAAQLAGLGPLWHRAEIETRAAALWGLEGDARLVQADRARAAQDALDAYQPGTRRAEKRRNNS